MTSETYAPRPALTITPVETRPAVPAETADLFTFNLSREEAEVVFELLNRHNSSIKGINTRRLALWDKLFGNSLASRFFGLSRKFNN